MLARRDPELSPQPLPDWTTPTSGSTTVIALSRVRRWSIQSFAYTARWCIEKHIRFVAAIRNTGRADILGFGDPGVFDKCYRAGWRIEKHLRFVSDLTGNGRIDLIGFGDEGVSIALNSGNGTFQAPNLVLKDFDYNEGGWGVEKNPRFIADLTSNKAGDIVGFGNNGVCPQSTTVTAVPASKEGYRRLCLRCGLGG